MFSGSAIEHPIAAVKSVLTDGPVAATLVTTLASKLQIIN